MLRHIKSQDLLTENLFIQLLPNTTSHKSCMLDTVIEPLNIIRMLTTFSIDDRFRDILESDIHGKSLKELENENNKIRENMKDLNEQLTKIIERSKVSNFAPKKVEFREKNIDDKIRTTLKEIENNQKILELTATEYTSTRERLEQIKDPGYILDLEEKIQKAKTDTETTRKTNKALGLVNGNVGRDLDGIDKADGVAPMIQEANDKARELAVMQRKLKKLKDMNSKFDEENDTKSSKFEKVKDEYKKLQSEADRYNIKLEDNKLAVQYANLQNQVKNLEGVVKLAANKNEKFLKSQIERAIEELILSNMKQNENIERLDTMIEEQKEVLKKMIEKEEQKNDKSVKDIIAKIKNSLDQPATIDEEPESAQRNQTKSETNLISKPPTKRSKKDIYSDLPLYKANDKNVKVDSLLNKKDIAKKEVNALRERVRNGEDNIRSQTPKAEHDIKGFPAKPKDNSKPNLKSNKSHEEAEKSFQQAEQQKLLEVKSEEKRKPTDSEVTLKPSFTKPNLFKKSTDSPPKESTFQSPEDKKAKQDDDIIVPPLTKRDNPLRLYKKEEGLKLPGQELTLGGKTDTPTTLKSPNTQGIFLTNQGASNSKREELLLPGSFDQKKKNDELILDNKKGNLLEPTPIVNKPNNDDDDLGIGNIGGLSRLNRLKKGGNNPSIGNNTEKITGLELPPQQNKLSSNSNTASLPLTLNNDLKLENTNQNQKVFNYDKNEGSARPRNIQQQSDDLFGGLDGGFGMGAKKQNNFGHEEITLKEQPVARGGRDRTHLFENNNNSSSKNEELSLFDNKKPVVAENKNAKGGFDPDDIFGSNTKPLVQQDSKPNVGGTLGGTGIPGVRTGRAGVAGRPKQITGEEDDLFGSNTKKETSLFGGGFGMGALNKEKEPTTNFSSNLNFGTGPETENKTEPKRMRMNDLNKKGDSTKTKVRFWKFFFVLTLLLGKSRSSSKRWWWIL